MLRILWIDPDKNCLLAVQSYFGKFPIFIQIAETKRRAMQELLIFQPECAILETRLPDGYGLDICKKIRSYSQMPVLFFTADLSPQTAIAAFHAGANDYIRKPCHFPELHCRIQKECKRSALSPKFTEKENEITINNLTIQLKSRKVLLNGDPINLTPIEFNLLLLMTEHVNQTVPIDTFYEKFWNSQELQQTSRVLQAHITNLRRKLKFRKNCNIHITNLYGKRYGLSVEPSSSPTKKSD